MVWGSTLAPPVGPGGAPSRRTPNATWWTSG